MTFVGQNKNFAELNEALGSKHGEVGAAQNLARRLLIECCIGAANAANWERLPKI